VDVSVSIVNWNRADLLEACLRSVVATSSSVAYEAIVVDNGSTDDSVTMVRTQFPQVRLIINRENRGFGRAHNQAISVSRGRYILLLNNDATVGSDTIPTLVDFMDQNPGAGICTCQCYRTTPSREPVHTAFPRFPSLSRAVLWNLWVLLRPPLGRDNCRFIAPIKRCLEEGLPPTIVGSAAWVVGALLMLRRDMLRTVGMFDERFFLFFEEIDLCRRALAGGWSVLFTPSTSYLHKGGGSSQLRADLQRLIGASGATYFRKHHGPLAAALFSAQHYALRRCLLPWRSRLGRVACRLLPVQTPAPAGVRGGPTLQT
jgi:GT2 family glycosyltransferase